VDVLQKHGFSRIPVLLSLKRILMRNLMLAFLFVPLLSLAQKREITLEAIFKDNTFYTARPAGFKADETKGLFTTDSLQDEAGNKIGTADYAISSNKRNVLLFNGIEPIYRRSTRSTAYLYDVATKKTVRLNEGKILHPTFSPDGRKIAYVYENNLYLYDIASAKTTPVTNDGKWNVIINGNADWVYEEEFEISRAYEWSPTGAYLAYYKFDESAVKEFNMTLFDSAYNKDYRYKYPKAGEANSKVAIHIYDVANAHDRKAKYDTGDIYIPRIKWAAESDKLVVFWMNRLQNHLKLLLTDAGTGASKPLYEEQSKWYIESNDDWYFLKDGFVFTSEKGSFRQLYYHSMDGQKKLQLSKGNYDIAEINGVDSKRGLVYYTLAYPTPMDRNLFVSDLQGKKSALLTTGAGTHRIELNADYSQFYDTYSTLNTPPTVKLFAIDTKKMRAVQKQTTDSYATYKNLLKEYDLGNAEFIKVPTSKGDTLNGWMLKPANFDASKKYPVLFCNYGGPGSQQVANRFGAVSFWHRMLAQKGYIVVSVDNTGTGYRGEEFKKKTYLQLGKLEIEDQIDAAKWMAQKPFVDAANIGHWGWSYGGFMSSLAITKGADVFSAAVAVAPVTNWRFYDNIYTERYMRTPEENSKGYDENAPVNFVDQIRGKYLLIHGTADDNVHFQNSAQMVTALVKANVDFETMYYPNKHHGISGQGDNTTFHLWRKMTNWIYTNLTNENVRAKPSTGNAGKTF
jgi:dipeptidyl-peptidase-4